MSLLSLIDSTKCANEEVANSMFEPSVTRPQTRHFNVPISSFKELKKTKTPVVFCQVLLSDLVIQYSQGLLIQLEEQSHQ